MCGEKRREGCVYVCEREVVGMCRMDLRERLYLGLLELYIFAIVITQAELGTVSSSTKEFVRIRLRK